MGRDEAVVTTKSRKPPSQPKDQPASYPYLDWSTVQAYYGPGFVSPTYFGPGIPSGHTPTPYMWGPQPLPPPALGKPYTAMYSHGGSFSHPFVPLMVNPLSAEPANMIVKEVDGTAMSTCSTNSEKTSEDCSLGGSSDGNNQKASGTPKKRRVDNRPISGIEACQTPGILATLPNLCILDTAIKPTASSASDFGVIGTPKSSESLDQDGRESKRERRKQSNRDSARRSRLRKQAETEELAKKVELLTAENTSLGREINRLTESSKKLSSENSALCFKKENSALMVKLTDAAPDQRQEVSPGQTIEQSARAVKNFMSMIDTTAASRSSGPMGHDAPKLRQLLGSGVAADAVAACVLPPYSDGCMWPGVFIDTSCSRDQTRHDPSGGCALAN